MGFAFVRDFLTGFGLLVIGVAFMLAGMYLIGYGIFEPLQDPWLKRSVGAGVFLIVFGAIVSLYARYRGRHKRDDTQQALPS